MAERDDIRRVERLNLAILARHGTRGLNQARRRLESLVADGARAALGSAQVPEGPGVWVIDRLELDIAIDPAMATAAIRRTVEGAALRSLVAALQPGRSGTLYLPRYSAYLARFLTHLAEGEAWSRWEYRVSPACAHCPPPMRCAQSSSELRWRVPLLWQEWPMAM